MVFLIDFEATCWENHHKPDFHEIIEIGIVACCFNLNIVGNFTANVKPKYNIKLSKKCKTLTGIQQQQIDKSENLPAVLDQIKNWSFSLFGVSIDKIPWCSWGKTDISMLKKDCERYNITNPFGYYLDMERLFCAREGIIGCSLVKAMGIRMCTVSGQHHRALDDAMTLHKILRYTMIDYI